MLILNREDIKAVVTMQDAIQAMEEAFRELAGGQVQVPPRHVINVPGSGEVLIMPGYLGNMRALGFKVVSSYPDNPERFGMPTVRAAIAYYDPTTGEHLALMDGTYLTAVRTGATSGLATRYLAREDRQVVGVLGAGVQAEAQLEAMCCVRSIGLAKVYSRSLSHAIAFAGRMSRLLGVDVRPVDSARDAVVGSDIVITATTSPHPVVMGDWLSSGTHINAIGAHTPTTRELDGNAISMAKVCVESLEAALQEAGDIIIPLTEGLIGRDHVYAALGELAAGQKPGRVHAAEITVFKSVGLAVEDVAIAKLAYDRAEARGVGLAV
jgi:alanine dehydrogenase